MISWILETIIFLAVLYAVQIPLRKKSHPVLNVLVFLVKLLLIPGTALLFVAIESPATYRRSDMFAAAYIILTADVCASIVDYVIHLLRRGKEMRTGERRSRLTRIGPIDE